VLSVGLDLAMLPVVYLVAGLPFAVLLAVMVPVSAIARHRMFG
jgi:hypothetical protein